MAEIRQSDGFKLVIKAFALARAFINDAGERYYRSEDARRDSDDFHLGVTLGIALAAQAVMAAENEFSNGFDSDD